MPRKPNQRKPERPSFSQFYRAFVSPRDPKIHDLALATNEIEKRVPDLHNPNPLRARAAWNNAVSGYRTISTLERKKIHADYIFQQIQFKGNETVLSIGSGLGWIEAYIAKYRVPNGRVLGIDFAEKMNASARAFAKKAQAQNFKVASGSSEKLPLPDASQDFVLVTNASWSTRETKEKSMKEIKRVLKHSPGSKVIFTTFEDTEKGIGEAKEIFKRTGFRIIHEKIQLAGTGFACYYTLKLA